MPRRRWPADAAAVQEPRKHMQSGRYLGRCRYVCARVSSSVGQGSGGRPERPIPRHCDCPYLYIPASIATQTSSALFPLPLAV